MRRTVRPTPYTFGPYRLATLRHRRGYAIVDTRHTGSHPRYTLTEPSLATGRPLPHLLPLSDALRAMRRITEEDRHPP